MHILEVEVAAELRAMSVVWKLSVCKTESKVKEALRCESLIKFLFLNGRGVHNIVLKIHLTSHVARSHVVFQVHVHGTYPRALRYM